MSQPADSPFSEAAAYYEHRPAYEHEPALRRSACFSRFAVREFTLEFERDIGSIIKYVYSLSTSPRSAIVSPYSNVS